MRGPAVTVGIFALFLTASMAHAADSFVAYYRLDGNARDSSTNQFDGLSSGTVPVKNRFGGANAALGFNGPSSVVDLGNRAAFNFAGDFTVTSWMKLEGPSAEKYMIAKYADYGGGNREPCSYGLGFDAGSRSYGFVSRGAGYAEVVGGPSLNDGHWHAVALTYENVFGVRLYVDGELIGQTAAPGLAPLTNGVPLQLGKAFTGQNFTGALDDVGIYDRALSIQEIRALFQVESSGAGVAIVEQPKHTWVEIGANATFTVGISGPRAPEATFQWSENGVPILGATNRLYTTGLQESPGRKVYAVTVSVAGLDLVSAPAFLTVGQPGQAGLLAHWTFDEEFGTTVLDHAGSYTGQVVNAMRTAGHVGSGALKLNGTDAYMLVGGQNSPLRLDDGPYTLSWWQQWNGPNGQHQVILAMDDGADFSGGYQAFLFRNSSQFAVVHSDGANETWMTGELSDSQWHHHAVTFDGSHLRFYRDGVLAATEPRQTPLIQDGDDPLVIGGLSLQNGAVVNLFNGILDEVRIYSRALSAEEVLKLGPLPEIVVSEQPRGARIGEGESIVLRVNAAVRGTTNLLNFQWEVDGAVIPGATNSILSITGSTGSTQVYRVLLRAGELQAYSDESKIETVSPSDARLLLHLPFEALEAGRFLDAGGGIGEIFGDIALTPGRVGTHGALLNGNGYVRIPAAGTDLELVGTSYTIAWWMKPALQVPVQQVFTLGEPLNGTTGFGARIEGPTFNRILRTEHRHSQPQPLFGAQRAGNNWVHVALVYNGFRRTIFTNGVAVSSIVTSADVVGSGRDDLLLGAAATNSLSNVGVLDDFRIYNYALASDEIAALVNVPAPGVRLDVSRSGENVVIRWPRDDSAQHRVESAGTLGVDAAWMPLAVPIESSALHHQVTQPATAETRFYRLRRL